ncbi:LuxR family transcriptional regulator [Nitrospirillum iridis]|uniref:DNA-binding CsgD family transcriptional regulator n=1 Tax=Nitrospirillum iridis TaxID=765888 RepID=A0A7X0EEM4_9PROT|nr:helix-turn-helix transcriptional regulator [Nitrospirillum iridis]MBB6251579.1 DNA-binding CsgD family transcriptional regulator [Nitrospirillum iridis]
MSSPLTHREAQILDLIGRGLSSGQIAAKLDIAELTVRKHRSSIMRKLGLNSTARLIAHAGAAVGPGPAIAAADPLVWDALRPREAEVVRHVVAGLTSKEIARLLDISPLTVRKHRERAREKLGIHTLGEMIFRGKVNTPTLAADL